MFNFEANQLYRALARFCDYCLFYLALSAVTLFLPFFYGPFFYYALALAVPLLWVPIEAFLISRWATTPGKALFGLSVRGAIGFDLPYAAAIKWSCFLPGSSGTVRQQSISWKRKLSGFAASSLFIMAAIFGNVLAMWSVGLGQGVSSDGWVQYASSDSKFQVSFPSDPEHESKQLVIPKTGKVLDYQEISTEKRKVVYSVSHMELPSKWRLAANTTLLKGVLDAIVKYSDDNKLIQKEFTYHQNKRALNFKMKQGDEEVRGRLIIVGKRLYKVTIAYPQSRADEMQENPFIDTFVVN